MNNQNYNADEDIDMINEITDKDLFPVMPYLPIGSIVLLKNGKKRVMIYGRKVSANGEDTVYDYLGCLYPEGAIDSNNVILFNHNQIQLVYFIGFQDLEEFVYRQNLDNAEV